MGQRTNYSVNVKKVKGNEYYVVNFRNAQGKVVEKSTGMKPLLKATTYDNYISMLNCHIISYFNERKLKLTDIKPMHLQGYINQTMTKVSSNTVRKHFSLIKTAMQDAVINDLIASNPASY